MLKGIVSKRILTASLMAVHSEAEKSVIVVLSAGEVITLLADVRESALVDVECKEGVVTVFHRDLLERSHTVARAAEQS